MTFRSGEYRAKAEYYAGRVETATNPEQRLEFQELEGSFKALADNEQWLANNRGKTVHSGATPQEGAALAREEEHVLRCLGAALLMHWDTLPEDIRREIFDNASAMGELLDTEALRQKIGRLLHKNDNATTWTEAAAPGSAGNIERERRPALLVGSDGNLAAMRFYYQFGDVKP